MRIWLILAFVLFLGQAVAELWPLPEDWRDVPVEVPVEIEPKPQPHRWHVPIKRSPLD